MSLWLDFTGAEIRYIQTKNYGRVRIAEAGDPANETLIFLHGIGGHMEAYAKNVVALSDQFHVVAYDYVGHGYSEKLEVDYSVDLLVEHLGEVMDALGVDKAHLSGESLGGWTSGTFACRYPERVLRLMLNTSAGFPILTDKGRADMADLARLSKEAAKAGVNYESIENRMKWLFNANNYHMITDELVNTRLNIYTQPEMASVAPRINAMMATHDDNLIPLDQIKAETLLLWTVDNPVHGVEVAEYGVEKIANAQMYVMKNDSAHWTQYEQPQDVNPFDRSCFGSGKI
ncbi:MAG: alpha/beta hydrolase [Gammaproteobacteria bacterium]